MKISLKMRLLSIFALVIVCFVSFCVANMSRASATEEVDTACFEMVRGASIRLSSDHNGIRFQVKFGSDVYRSIMTREVGTDVRVGAIIVPASFVNNAAAYKSGASIGDYDQFKKYKDACFYDSANAEIENKIYQDEGYYYGNAVIADLLYDNLGLDFVGIGYIKWTTGEVVTYDFINLDDVDVVRSAAYVASAHYGKETEDDRKEVVDYYAYGSLFAKTGVVSFADGQYTVYGEDKYDTVAEVMTAINGSLELNVEDTSIDIYYPQISDNSVSMQLRYASTKGGAATSVASGVNFAIANSSEDEDIAVYEKGVFKSKGKGEATITFSCMGVEETCDVTVIRNGTPKAISSVDLDLSKDSAATFALDAGETARTVLLDDVDITDDVSASLGSLSIPKSVLQSTKGDRNVEIFTENYEYESGVCVADYVLSNYDELVTFRTAAKNASDQSQESFDDVTSTALTYSDTWNWYVVLDADITCAGTFTERVSYFGVLDGRGHSISNIAVGETDTYQRGGFFDNRIEGGEEGVTDSEDIMHAGVGLRVQNLAILNISGTRSAFVRTTTKGSTFSNIYLTGSTGLVDGYVFKANNGVQAGKFENIVVSTDSYRYFPSSQLASQTWDNIESASRIYMFSSNGSPFLPTAFECVGYTDAAAFYTGVKAAIDDNTFWNVNVWGEDAIDNITFGGTAIINKIRTQKAISSVDLDLSKDSAATFSLDAGETAAMVMLDSVDITSNVSASSGSLSIPKSVLQSTKGDRDVVIYTDNYEYTSGVCVADYVLSDYSELVAFRTAAKNASDQSQAQLGSTDYMSLTYSDTWDWYVVLDANITCTGTFTERVSYFGVLDGRGHSISNISVGETHTWQRGGFFDNRIEGGDVGVKDSEGTTHEVGLRVKNLAILNISGTRSAFVRTATKGSSFSNIYLTGSIGLVEKYLYSVKTGSFQNIVVSTTAFLYFPMGSGASQTWTNIEEAGRIYMLSTIGNPKLPDAYHCTGYNNNASGFYNGVKTEITSGDSTWSSVWGLDASNNITFGGTVIISAS